MTLSGKTILVTGAAKRLGRIIALSAARNGADVIIHHAHSQGEASTLAEEIQALHRNSWVLQADLSSPENALSLIQAALSLSPLYAIINSAAVFHSETWDETSFEIWQSTLNLNLTAPFLITQAFARSLPPDTTGRVINLIDWRALRPGADHFAYTVSKAALAALTRSYAQALAPRINVNAIALGAILPPAGESLDPHLLDSVPLERWATMEELEKTVQFLLDGPEEITGAVIHLDGGRHLI